MQIYLVGGAVRDKLLGRKAYDRDYVVVGARPEELTARGFTPVGKDFPVFLHPQTHEEYALARTERKHGHGYHGFTFHTEPTVTLDEDLVRRDLTINAMAEDERGRLVDPYGGKADLDARLLRHVSPAFAEDPVRILRVARFAARFAPLGFRVAAATLALMRDMVTAGEVDHLVPERVWAETLKALAEPRPSAYLAVLRDCDALAAVLPEVDALYGVPQGAQYHPEVDSGRHLELALDMAAQLAPNDSLTGFCTLTHDLGKPLTPASQLPDHRGHAARGLAPLRALAARLRVPTEYRDLALATCREHMHAHRALDLPAAQILDLFDHLDIWRRAQRLTPFLTTCEADWRGRQGFAEEPYPQADYLRAAHAAAAAITAAPFVAAGQRGPAIGTAMREARISAIAALPKPDHEPLQA